MLPFDDQTRTRRDSNNDVIVSQDTASKSMTPSVYVTKSDDKNDDGTVKSDITADVKKAFSDIKNDEDGKTDGTNDNKNEAEMNIDKYSVIEPDDDVTVDGNEDVGEDGMTDVLNEASGENEKGSRKGKK
ncbi:hypothetical protein AC249_AIPGENE10052 [Exaiptasia diaphana]|nr:hypothetical protein AC249_AIPGENE10052 [Exaiptasia diaphana]